MGNQSSCSEVSPDGRVLSFRVEGDEEAQSAETNTLELQRVFSWLLSACSSQCYDMLPPYQHKQGTFGGVRYHGLQKERSGGSLKVGLKSFSRFRAVKGTVSETGEPKEVWQCPCAPLVFR